MRPTAVASVARRHQTRSCLCSQPPHSIEPRSIENAVTQTCSACLAPYSASRRFMSHSRVVTGGNSSAAPAEQDIVCASGIVLGE